MGHPCWPTGEYGLLGPASDRGRAPCPPGPAACGDEWDPHARRKRDLYNALRVGHLAYRDMDPGLDSQTRQLIHSRSAKAGADMSKDEQVALAVELLT